MGGKRRRSRALLGCAALLGAGAAILAALTLGPGRRAFSFARQRTREAADRLGRYGSSPRTQVGPLLHRLGPSPSFASPPPAPASPAAGRVMELLTRVEARTRRTRYQHHTQVREGRGEYYWDCSGMAGWVLRRAAPRARRSLGARRPVARTFARRIEGAPTHRPRRGWQRLGHIREVRPGDVFAWEKPPDFPSQNTGHVGFVVNAPVQLSHGLWAVRILDATSLPHQDDTRGQGGSGSGRGTMTFLTDGSGHATAYGWHGQRSLGYIETPIRFGRVW